MKIQQLSIAYLETQDRVLVRIATDAEGEIRLWLTFRLTGRLLPGLRQTAADIEASRTPMATHDDHSKQMLADFRRAQSVQEADFSTPFRQDAKAFPLGSSPLLVTQVQVGRRTDGHVRLGFIEGTEEGRTPRQFSITLDPGLLHSVIHLLEAAVRKAQWPLALPPAPDKPAPTARRPALVN